MGHWLWIPIDPQLIIFNNLIILWTTIFSLYKRMDKSRWRILGIVSTIITISMKIPRRILCPGGLPSSTVHGHWKLPMLLIVFVDGFGGTIILLTLKNRTKSKYFGRFLSSPRTQHGMLGLLSPIWTHFVFTGGWLDDRCLVGSG